MWPDWAIYWTFGKLLKSLATINFPKSPKFLGNSCKGVKINHFSSELIFGNFKDVWQFVLVTLSPSLDSQYVTSAISLMVGHFDYKHRCLVEMNVHIVFIVPRKWQNGAESKDGDHKQCMVELKWRLCFWRCKQFMKCKNIKFESFSHKTMIGVIVKGRWV